MKVQQASIQSSTIFSSLRIRKVHQATTAELRKIKEQHRIKQIKLRTEEIVNTETLYNAKLKTAFEFLDRLPRFVNLTPPEQKFIRSLKQDIHKIIERQRRFLSCISEDGQINFYQLETNYYSQYEEPISVLYAKAINKFGTIDRLLRSLHAENKLNQKALFEFGDKTRYTFTDITDCLASIFQQFMRYPLLFDALAKTSQEKTHQRLVNLSQDSCTELNRLKSVFSFKLPRNPAYIENGIFEFGKLLQNSKSREEREVILQRMNLFIRTTNRSLKKELRPNVARKIKQARNDVLLLRGELAAELYLQAPSKRTADILSKNRGQFFQKNSLTNTDKAGLYQLAKSKGHDQLCESLKKAYKDTFPAIKRTHEWTGAAADEVKDALAEIFFHTYL